MQAFRHIDVGLRSPLLIPSHHPRNKLPKFHSSGGGGGCSTIVCSASKWADRLLSDFHFTTSTDNSPLSSTTVTLSPPPPPPERHVSIPIDFYQVLGAETHFLGDGIKRAYDARVSKPPQYGFSEDALISRRQILHAACETLASPASRREYNQGLVDDEDDTIITQVPWDQVPGALCVLQEAGETEVVLRIGESLLRERLPKSFKQDVVLAMALAYVDVSRDAMALNPPDFIKGCEVLERALNLLQEEGASSLAPDLQAQIDETLEEITPRCVLELLALPLRDEYRVKRQEGLRGVRNILWAVGGGGAAAIAGGFTREDFMNEAFLCMTAAEQVDLFVATPSNIPAESFEVYGVALALVAQAFVGKKPHLIRDADNLFQQLQQNKVATLGDPVSIYAAKVNREVDFALERGLCSLLVGELDECRLWLGLDSDSSPYRNPSIVEFVLENSKNDDDNDLPGLCKLLETWLTEVVFPRFRDTNDVQFKLGDYYDDSTVLRYLEGLEGNGSSPLAAAAAIVRVGAAEATASMKKTHLSCLSISFPSTVELMATKMICIFQFLLLDLKFFDNAGSLVDESSVEELPIMDAKRFVSYMLQIKWHIKLGLLMHLQKMSMLVWRCISIPHQAWVANAYQIHFLVALFTSSKVLLHQYVNCFFFSKFSNTKNNCQVLDGQMLKIWTDRAAEIAQLGWIYDYTLLKLTIDSVTLSQDGRHAWVEATVEESARLTDPIHPENSDSKITSYTTRYEMSGSESGWKITEGSKIIYK
ncbi:hypothetical protein JRO89_XS07G0028000 [Xanthoceras sorbifolium]|uniref:ARC6 IMS domain-containing protein n=1 Tax=Xanthoceras sorbifolium TaxID=99658 RepID=A0ABQ8HSA4_9ROSI|nr:hypothetical protein JRO89_XS07G0028000 [Xanthoceras sorbifolium]